MLVLVLLAIVCNLTRGGVYPLGGHKHTVHHPVPCSGKFKVGDLVRFESDILGVIAESKKESTKKEDCTILYKFREKDSLNGKEQLFDASKFEALDEITIKKDYYRTGDIVSVIKSKSSEKPTKCSINGKAIYLNRIYWPLKSLDPESSDESTDKCTIGYPIELALTQSGPGWKFKAGDKVQFTDKQYKKCNIAYETISIKSAVPLIEAPIKSAWRKTQTNGCEKKRTGTIVDYTDDYGRAGSFKVKMDELLFTKCKESKMPCWKSKEQKEKAVAHEDTVNVKENDLVKLTQTSPANAMRTMDNMHNYNDYMYHKVREDAVWWNGYLEGWRKAMRYTKHKNQESVLLRKKHR